jgi:hypothetical protein
METGLELVADDIKPVFAILPTTNIREGEEVGRRHSEV